MMIQNIKYSGFSVF